MREILSGCVCPGFCGICSGSIVYMAEFFGTTQVLETFVSGSLSSWVTKLLRRLLCVYTLMLCWHQAAHFFIPDR